MDGLFFGDKQCTHALECDQTPPPPPPPPPLFT